MTFDVCGLSYPLQDLEGQVPGYSAFYLEGSTYKYIFKQTRLLLIHNTQIHTYTTQIQ